ncbi:MAG: CtsR family transcriptional regulator [Oscillospiraceae bacterium]|jgi:transcriptional regulator CtsR|nr:CtsR family transcriptional regulator [Oscillospiraceae bacterium]
MGISDVIAGFIGGLLSESDGCAEIQRAELASKFNCVPSQINYVISTRFSPERGYIVESRRGGNGYIRITRVNPDPERLVMHTVNAIGDAIDLRCAAALVANLAQSSVISESAARVMLSAVGESALRSAPREARGVLRAGILKQMLINLEL